MRLQLAKLAAAGLVTAAASLGVVAGSTAPAAATGCSGATGVTVVVDHGSLGGGVETSCNAGGGGQDGISLFTGAGFSLTYVQRQPGFVCRINGQPASDPCVNTPPSDAYWGLFWSDGKSGSWSYASAGAGSLHVPDGGYIAFAWQSGARNNPNAAPTPHASAPTPSTAPTAAPTSGGGGNGGGGNGGGGNGGGGGHGSGTPSGKPSTKPSTKPSSKPSTKPSATATSVPAPTPAPSEGLSPSASEATPTAAPTVEPSPSESALLAASDPAAGASTPSDSASATAAEVPDSQPGDTDALPGWVVALVLVVLAGGGGATYLLRRRQRTSP